MYHRGLRREMPTYNNALVRNRTPSVQGRLAKRPLAGPPFALPPRVVLHDRGTQVLRTALVS